MPTAHLHRSIQDKVTGKLILGSTVSLCAPGTETPISAQLYSDSGLTQTLPNPYGCIDGIIDVYLADRVTVQIRIQYGTAVELADNIDILPMAESIVTSPTKLDVINSPGTNLILTGIDSATAHWQSLTDALADLNAVLLGWFLTQAFQYQNIVRDANGAMSAADVTWPDGKAGHYTADVISAVFPGKVDAWHVTRIDGATTTTFTQPLVTRDSIGNVTVMPLVLVT